MGKSVLINGLDYPLVLVSTYGSNWYPKYHISNCALGYIAGDLCYNGNGFYNIAIWKLIKTNLPEKQKKKKYRPYNDDEMERLFDEGVILVNKTTMYDGMKSKIFACRNGEANLVIGWVGRRELFNDWKNKDGSPCGVEVDNDEE